MFELIVEASPCHGDDLSFEDKEHRRDRKRQRVIMEMKLSLSPSPQIKGAEIVVACFGKPKFVQGSWLKDHAVVIDCGITSVHGQTFVSRSFLRYSSVHCSGEWQISSVR
jgi:5,10-methylene-tetrahydrofolate dehydrogenase/methenyl tetrahydrofolate cyclohydrolase